MIVDASVIVDAVADGELRGAAARAALAAVPPAEPLQAPGHLAIEVMSALKAAANRPAHPFQPESIVAAWKDAATLGVAIIGTPWGDVRRAWSLSTALRYSDAVYVAAAERLGTSLLTADRRIAASGAVITCRIVTVAGP